MEFVVELLRWEKEMNPWEMTFDDKCDFVARRRLMGNDMFAKKRFASAASQVSYNSLVYFISCLVCLCLCSLSLSLLLYI